MPVEIDFRLSKFEDITITIPLAPPTPIGGWEVKLSVAHRFGGSGLIQKSMASGRYNVSGMNIVNSGAGIMSAKFYTSDTSGLAYGNYAYQCERLDSGSRTVLTQGFMMLLP